MRRNSTRKENTRSGVTTEGKAIEESRSVDNRSERTKTAGKSNGENRSGGNPIRSSRHSA